jgi:hypothetical protein
MLTLIWRGIKAFVQLHHFRPLELELDGFPSSLSAISAHGTVLRDCVAEGLRFIFTPIGVEDDEEPKDRASETHDDEGACRAGR